MTLFYVLVFLFPSFPPHTTHTYTHTPRTLTHTHTHTHIRTLSSPFPSLPSLSLLAGVDYFRIDATFSLSGTQQRCFDFISINDNVPELTEVAVVTITTFDSFWQVLEQRQEFVSILDDDSERIFHERLETVRVYL